MLCIFFCCCKKRKASKSRILWKQSISRQTKRVLEICNLFWMMWRRAWIEEQFQLGWLSQVDRQLKVQSVWFRISVVGCLSQNDSIFYFAKTKQMGFPALPDSNFLCTCSQDLVVWLLNMVGMSVPWWWLVALLDFLGLVSMAMC